MGKPSTNGGHECANAGACPFVYSCEFVDGRLTKNKLRPVDKSAARSFDSCFRVVCPTDFTSGSYGVAVDVGNAVLTGRSPRFPEVTVMYLVDTQQLSVPGTFTNNHELSTSRLTIVTGVFGWSASTTLPFRFGCNLQFRTPSAFTTPEIDPGIGVSGTERAQRKPTLNEDVSGYKPERYDVRISPTVELFHAPPLTTRAPFALGFSRPSFVLYGYVKNKLLTHSFTFPAMSYKP